MTALTVTELIAVLDCAIQLVGTLKDKYGIIHKQAFIKYKGHEGRLVWDYILLNELTFEDFETGERYSLGFSGTDKNTEKLFDELVEKFGV